MLHRIFLSLIAGSLLLATASVYVQPVFAQVGPPPPPGQPQPPVQPKPAAFTNPIPNIKIDPKAPASGIQQVIVKLINFMLYITVALAVGGIVWGGLKIIWPFQDRGEKSVNEGKKIIAGSIIGLIFIFLALLAVRLVGKILGVPGV